MRRFLRRVVVLTALLAVAAGTSGDIGSFAERFREPVAAAAAVNPGDPNAAFAAAPITAPTRPPEWTLYAAGDVLMDRSERAPRDPFTKLVPPLSAADLAVVNVEMSIADVGTPQAGKEFTFQAPPSAARTIAGAGIDVASLGNNHSLDFGRDALLQAIASLESNGVAPIGAGTTADEAFAPATFEVGGGDRTTVSVAFIGASGVVPGGWEVDGQPGLATTRGDRLVAAVRAAAGEHDVVIAVVHWGQERATCPSGDQIATGDALIDAGADAVIGHHPHVLQPVVERGGGLVAYSLGNFVWHPRSGPQGETGVLELRFVGDQLDAHSFHPHVLDGNGDPEPAGVEATARIDASVADHCGLS